MRTRRKPGIPVVTTPSGLCQRCAHCREVVSGRGSRFYLCRRSATDKNYPKYPPQPVRVCAGFQQTEGPTSGR